MLLTDRMKAAAKPAVVSCMVGMVISFSAQMTLAGYIGVPGRMQATRVCTFSERLQNSVEARREYLVALSTALGGAAPAVNDVEAMYGSIKKASYEESEPAVNMFGFESTSTESETVGGLDKFSTACLGCHDGVGAIAITADIRNDPYRKHKLFPGSDHPLGMEYSRYAGVSRNFKQLWGDTGKMIFVNGKVGCLTCHDPINPEKGHLVMSDRNSALCLTCHNK